MAQSEQTVGAFEAKTRLSELLRETERGSSFTILRRGTPVARLVPPATEPWDGEVASLLAAFHEVRAQVDDRVDVRELIEEGRRW